MGFLNEELSEIHRVEVFFGKTSKQVIRAQISHTSFHWARLSLNRFRLNAKYVDILATFKNQRRNTIKSGTYSNFFAILLIIFFNRFCDIDPTNESTVVKSLLDPLDLFKIYRILIKIFNFLITAQICWTLRISFWLVLEGVRDIWRWYCLINHVWTSDLIQQFYLKLFQPFTQDFFKNLVYLLDSLFGKFFLDSDKLLNFLALQL